MDMAMQLVADEAAIRKVHMRYCRGVDRRDWEMVRSCYHPDAIDDHSGFANGYVGGVDGFIDYARSGIQYFDSTSHFTANQLVEVDGDSAWAEHYVRAYHRRHAREGEPARDFVGNARYVDRLERRGGEWRILKRVVIVDTSRVDPVAADWADPASGTARNDRSDPSYGV